jgi:flagellar biosynthesis chaperone FliJ
MKRFRWRLQRVLDITEQRERALRAELLALAQAIARVRQEILGRQALVRTILAELAQRSLPERLPEQALVLQCAAAEERILRRLRTRQKDLETQRAAKTEAYLRIRARRETLRRLREEARQKHLREQLLLEQKQFDETAHLAYARIHA